ncbi:hypothetical protein GW916_14650 [bacterium]|nr:hypothetical protein [bacterium]
MRFLFSLLPIVALSRVTAIVTATVPVVALAMGDHKPKGSFEVHGHRGARALEPENSMAAFHLAMDKGVHVIEADMVVTKDNHIVLNHDLTINTQLCHSNDPKLKKLVTPKVSSLTLAQVQSYDCGARVDPDFPKRKVRPGTRIPTLKELLALANEHREYQPQLKLNLETKIAKDASSKNVKQFVKLLLSELRDSKFPPKNLIIQSFDFRSLRELRSTASKIEISALVGEGYDFEQVTQGLRPDYLSPHGSHISKTQIKAAHKLGIKVIPWTLNKPSHWSRFIGMGVDGIITDDPVGLLDYLKK